MFQQKCVQSTEYKGRYVRPFETCEWNKNETYQGKLQSSLDISTWTKIRNLMQN